MKREEIIAKWDGMSARERDAWIAHVLFGWTGADIDMTDLAYKHGITGVAQYPSYTTHMHDAWRVVRAIPGEFFLYRKTPDQYVASFGYSAEECPECGIDPFEVTAQGKGKTAPEAIGLAAIIAKLATED